MLFDDGCFTCKYAKFDKEWHCNNKSCFAKKNIKSNIEQLAFDELSKQEKEKILEESKKYLDILCLL